MFCNYFCKDNSSSVTNKAFLEYPFIIITFSQPLLGVIVPVRVPPVGQIQLSNLLLKIIVNIK